MKLFVAIPALNEEKTIAQVVSGIPRDIPGVESVQPIVIDDGSTDSTADRATAAGAIVLSHSTNRGVGAAFHTALTYVIENRGDLLVSIDADGQFNPADVPELARPVIDGQADFTTASRFKDPSLLPEMPAVKLWGNRMMSRLVSRLTGGKFYDVSCGMRCYSRKAMLHLNLLGAFTYTQEVFLNLAFKRLRIVEVPIRVRGQREFGKSRVASNLFRYAINTSRIIFRAYRDYRPMRFFGGIAMWLGLPAFGLGLFFILVNLIDPPQDRFAHKWAAFLAMALCILSLISLHIGLIGDMLNRHRVYLEELLYRQREGAWREQADNALPPRASEAVRAAAHEPQPESAVTV